MQKILRAVALVMFVLGLSACSTVTYTPFNGYSVASDEDVKTVREGGYSEVVLGQIALAQHPEYNGGKIPPAAFKMISELGISCQVQIHPQLAGPVQAAVGGAVPYGVAGIGTGLGATTAFKGASFKDYTAYGAISYLFSGAVNGVITGSYSMASAKGTCIRDFWDLSLKKHPELVGTVVEVVLAGKAVSNSVPPALERKPVLDKQQPVPFGERQRRMQPQ